MKTISTFLLFYFFIACGQTKKETPIRFSPEGKIVYNYKMISDQLNINGTFDANFTKKNDFVQMNVEISDISATTNDNQDLGYSQYIGDTYIRQYNHLGTPVDLDNVPKQIINTDLFIVEFPESTIIEGQVWKGKKTAKPDMFFDFIDVEYKCTLIKNDYAFISAKMNFVSKDKFSADIKMTRQFSGEYIVDLKDGTVSDAKLYMDMFSGFSQLKGTIEIKRL